MVDFIGSAADAGWTTGSQRGQGQGVPTKDESLIKASGFSRSDTCVDVPAAACNSVCVGSFSFSG